VEEMVRIKMKELKAGFDNYCLYPLNLLPHEFLKWAKANDAEGVAFSGFSDALREKFSTSYLHDVRQMSGDLGLYIEWGNGQHVPMDLTSFAQKEIYQSNRKAVSEANALGTNIIRSCSGGLMRWKKDAPDTEIILRKTANELKKQAQMFRDNGVILAIETHFEFTTFELLRLFEMCETEPGDYLGICLDTMNLLTMLEDPQAATERILPWVVSTHIKDGGILSGENGITTFPAPFGKGIINFESIIEMLLSLKKEIYLSVENHGGSFFLPVNEKWFIDRFPDLSVSEYNKLLELAELTSDKIKNGNLKITERDNWPSICEERTRNDIRNLKNIRDRLNLN
jgi:sugar phosphate isomerase/epimerase